jgi:sugar porter (SP) family MFS transporter
VTHTNVRVVVIASLAGLLFGIDTAVISGVTGSVAHAFSLSALGKGLAVSSALWGTLVGALVAGSPGDRFGARATLRVVGILYVVSAIGCALAPNLLVFVVCRFVTGLAIGGSSVLAPVYISEISPAQRRGALVGLFQFNIVLGILAAYCSNYVVGRVLGDADPWRWKMAVVVIPALVFSALLLAIPDSPRWLLVKGRTREAADSLRSLGSQNPTAALQELQATRAAASGTTAERLSWARHRRPILLALLLAMFNQLSGINAILYYLGDIFTAAGFSSLSADLQSVAIGATNLLATVLAMSIIDRVGRKTLLLVGSVGMVFALSGVAVIMTLGEGRSLLLWLLAAFIGFFAFSQGAVIWVYLSEVFPGSVRARGQSLGSATHWGMNALISAVFPVIAARALGAPFAFFAAMMVLQWVAVARFFPETKGVTLESIEQLMAGTARAADAPAALSSVK